MYDAWDRFKDLLKRCPQHGFELWFQAQTFYNGLNYATRSMVDAAVGGFVMNKTAEEPCDLYEDMATSHYQAPSNRNIGRRVAGVLEVDQLSAIQAQIASLTNQLANQKGPTMGQVAMMQSQPGQVQHSEEQFGVEDVQFVGNMNYQFRPNNNLPAHYHPGLRNHQNFSYSNPRNALNAPPPGFLG